MQLIRRRDIWDPIREMEELGSRMNRFFTQPRWFGDGERELMATMDWSPACDISESETAYHIRAELPSVRKEDVHVTLENGVLTLQGERKEEKEEKGMRYHRRELTYGNFVRRFTLPDDADDSKVDAKFQNGILNLEVGKSKKMSGRAKEVAIH